MARRSNQFIVFTRYPVPGKVKTRLIPALGSAGAAEFQRTIAETTIRTARKAASVTGADVAVQYEGGTKRQMLGWLGPGLMFLPQTRGDLGLRMYAAFEDAFRTGYRKVLLFGTDIPDLSPRHLEEALEALEGKDLVLGPSTDGGYWLIGLKRQADLYQGIQWGSEGVLRETLRAAEQKGLSSHLLSPLTDIDTVEGLRKAMPASASSGPYVSVIIPALNEASNIKSTIGSAKDDESEIIVVDAGSRDGTVESAAAAGARTVEARSGRAAQQNAGAEIARGKVLLFLHADTRLPDGYVSHVFETLMDRRVVLGAFGFRTDLATPLMRLVEIATWLRSRYLHLPYGDQALFLRRAAFMNAGGFPEVPIAEDLLLVRRLSSCGRVAIAPAQITTSARRWEERGILRTSLMNQVVVVGLLLGISQRTLARLYRGRHREGQK
ncbi:MAG: TIGR04283 family arsenosugar biosynthesis glycosyltransferase [Thermodesulfobacteriota bacterium]